jgi:hypothetical protein
MYGRNVTMLEDLPDLEDLDRGGHGQQQPQQPDHNGFANSPGMPQEKLQKYLRRPQQFNPSSGMVVEHPMRLPPPPPQYPRDQELILPPPEMQINCIDIARHVQNCPICSRFYNNDRSVYIIAIVVLCIVCLLLLKRVLNV